MFGVRSEHSLARRPAVNMPRKQRANQLNPAPISGPRCPDRGPGNPISRLRCQARALQKRGRQLLTESLVSSRWVLRAAAADVQRGAKQRDSDVKDSFWDCGGYASVAYSASGFGARIFL